MPFLALAFFFGTSALFMRNRFRRGTPCPPETMLFVPLLVLQGAALGLPVHEAGVVAVQLGGFTIALVIDWHIGGRSVSGQDANRQSDRE